MMNARPVVVVRAMAPMTVECANVEVCGELRTPFLEELFTKRY